MSIKKRTTTLAAATALALTSIVTMATPAFAAHCTDSGGPGNSDFAAHVRANNGPGGHDEGDHRGWSSCEVNSNNYSG